MCSHLAMFKFCVSNVYKASIKKKTCLKYDNHIIIYLGGGGAADLKISKSAQLTLNHHYSSNIQLIYIKQSSMESLSNYIALEINPSFS